MKTRWKRPAVVVSGYSVMDTPPTPKATSIIGGLKEEREALIEQGYTAKELCAYFRDEHGIFTTRATQQTAIRKYHRSKEA